MYFLYFVLAIIPILFLLILLHELGYAIPALLFTDKPVIIYIGCTSDISTLLNLKLGRLVIKINYNPFRFKGGRCMACLDGLSQSQRIIYASGGLFAYLLMIIVIWTHLYFNRNGQYFSVEGIFSLALIIIFIKGLISSKLLSFSKINKMFKLAREYEHIREYTKSAKTYAAISLLLPQGPDAYRCLIYANVNMKEYDQALKRFRQLEVTFPPLSFHDHQFRGTIFHIQGRYEEALYSYNRAWEMKPDDPTNNSYLGLCYIDLTKYVEAILKLNETIQKEPDNSFAYANRGVAKIKSGDEEQGLQDIQRAIELKKDEPYAYRAMGIYYLEKKLFLHALIDLQRAKNIHPRIYGIEKLIALAVTHLSEPQ